LKTTSPTWVPEAPNDFALQIEPSSSTSLASEFFQGLSPLPMSHATELHQLTILTIPSNIKSEKYDIHTKWAEKKTNFHAVNKWVHEKIKLF